MADHRRVPQWRRLLTWAMVIALPLGVFSCWNATRPSEGGPAAEDVRL